MCAFPASLAGPALACMLARVVAKAAASAATVPADGMCRSVASDERTLATCAPCILDATASTLQHRRSMVQELAPQIGAQSAWRQFVTS